MFSAHTFLPDNVWNFSLACSIFIRVFLIPSNPFTRAFISQEYHQHSFQWFRTTQIHFFQFNTRQTQLERYCRYCRGCCLRRRIGISLLMIGLHVLSCHGKAAKWLVRANIIFVVIAITSTNAAWFGKGAELFVLLLDGRDGGRGGGCACEGGRGFGSCTCTAPSAEAEAATTENNFAKLGSANMTVHDREKRGCFIFWENRSDIFAARTVSMLRWLFDFHVGRVMFHVHVISCWATRGPRASAQYAWHSVGGVQYSAIRNTMLLYVPTKQTPPFATKHRQLVTLQKSLHKSVTFDVA